MDNEQLTNRKMVDVRGFTLIELLIVVSIIALLATIGMVTYQQVLKNGRDAKRQADLKLLQSAFEQFRADQGFYPPAINFAADTTLTNATGQTGVTVTRTYLKTIPHDPKALDYSYTAYKLTNPATTTVCVTASDCLDYCLYSQVENTANSNKDAVACPNDSSSPTARTFELTKP